MSTTRPSTLRLQSNAILALLLAIAVAAWIVLVWQQNQHARMDMPMAETAVHREVLLFLADWIVMMAAMMFPAVTPMALTFHKMKAIKHPLENAFGSAWIFVSAYLLVWSIAGLAAYAGLQTARYISARAALSTTVSDQLGGLIIVAAGLYQLTPLKEFCLSHCRMPIRFIDNSWREGRTGPFRMGLIHGFYCFGCCWLLFIILFPLGMSVISMIAVTAFILSERRILFLSQPISHTAGVALVFYGAFIVISQQILPIPKTGEMTMPAEMEMPATGRAPHVR